jgi:hypothetical protein
MSYKRLEPEDITLSAESIVAPCWTGDTVDLNQIFKSDVQQASTTGNFFLEVYNQDPDNNDNAEAQFSIAFADKQGRGSEKFDLSVPFKTPTSTVYGQYRSLVLGDEDTEFKFGGQPSDYFYVINVNRSRYKEKLFPGSLNLVLENNGNRIQLTDNSEDVDTISFVDSGRVFEIVSGSNGSAYQDNGFASEESGSYGKFLPDVGVILLNGNVLDDPTNGIGLDTNLEADSNGQNTQKLFDAIESGSSQQGPSFTLRSEETVTSNFVFVRVRNSEFNYSTNPSNITGSGELTHDVMVNSPQAYITTVGMYNDSNDLLAVAKLSRPLLKDFTKEALIRIKLDY